MQRLEMPAEEDCRLRSVIVGIGSWSIGHGYCLSLFEGVFSSRSRTGTRRSWTAVGGGVTGLFRDGGGIKPSS